MISPLTSICTTCKGRLEHLKETLQSKLDAAESCRGEVVILDYDSPDGLRGWVFDNHRASIESGLLNYYHAPNLPVFRMAHAKNAVALLSSFPIILNSDADVFEVETTPVPPGLFVHAGFLPNIGGHISVHRADFMRLGGYDESMVGWGYEDLDFKNRAMRMGLNESVVEGCRPIEHSDDYRNEFCGNAPIRESRDRNAEAAKSVIRVNDGIRWGEIVVEKNFNQWVKVWAS